MEISVIIPIYEVENYIEKCLRSLFEQTKTYGVEFILVNDCTPDGSMTIARKIIGEYPQLAVRILEHAENRGVAATRQTGLDAAVGEYTIQIDSDDWCELNMLEEMYAKAIEENADIVACDYFDNEGEIIRNKHSSDKFTNIENIIVKNIVYPCVWSRLIKRNLYIKSGLKCNNGIDYGEDLLIMPMLYYVADKITYHPKAYVHYMYNPKSLTQNHNINILLHHAKITCIWDSFFAKSLVPNKLRSNISDLRLREKHYLLRSSTGEEQREYNKLFSISNRTIFKSKKNATSAKVTLFLANIGLLPISNFLYYLGDKWRGRK